MFEIGDRVLWFGAAPPAPAIGTVLKIIPNDDNRSDFTLYDVEFGFGRSTLHGSELSLISTSVSSCGEKNRLWDAYQKALDAYLKGVLELRDAMGMMAHTEFEFLLRKVESTRDAAQAAHHLFDEHAAEHRC